MGMGRRAMVYLGLAEEDEGYVDDDYEADEPVRETAVSRPVRTAEPSVQREPSRVREVRDVRERDLARTPEVSVSRRSRPDVRVDALSVDQGRGSAAPRLAESMSPDPDDSTPSYQITTLQPRSYNEARQIGEAFRQHIPVIMNLTDMADEDAKRLVDFAAGLIFGLHGSIEKVTNKVFLLSPSSVAVSAEDKRRIVAGGFYNQS
jgi:cell division inhibitor SepF